MAIILNIDTAVDSASVCLANGSEKLEFAMHSSPKDHAAWLHPAIEEIMAKAGWSLKKLDAVAVTIGPGSYTGLRVGLATAKGLCFALDKPLIPVNTLSMMAAATLSGDPSMLLCPLIDARRMEVFTAVFDHELIQIIESKALIVDAKSFDDLLAANKIIFSGNGTEKLRKLVSHANAVFSDKQATAADMMMLSQQYYMDKKFADMAYVEPLYLKEFYTTAR